MSICVLQLSGRLSSVPPTSYLDDSDNPSWIADILERLPCSARSSEVYTLTADGDTPISFGALPNGVNVVVVKVMPNVGIPPSPLAPAGIPAVPNPLTVKLTSTLGVAPIPVDGFMFLRSDNIPFTAMTIARTAGVQTTARVQLFAVG